MAQSPPCELPAVLSYVAQTLELLPLPALLLDPTGSPCHMNPAAGRMVSGAAQGEAKGVADLFDGAMHEAIEAVLKPELFDQGAVEVLCQERHRGQLFRVSATALEVPLHGRFLVVVLHQGGDLVGLSQGAVQLREDAMQAVIDASSEAMLLFDAELRCVLSNGLVKEATGYTAEELSRKTLVDLGIIKDPAAVGKVMDQAALGQGAQARGILTTARAERLPVRAQIALLMGSSTRAMGLCSFPPPRITSNRLAAIRQSGTFSKPGAGMAAGGKASGGAVGGGTGVKMAPGASAPPRGSERPSGSQLRQGLGRGGEALPSTKEVQPGISIPAPTTQGRPSKPLQVEKTEPSPPPQAPELIEAAGGMEGDGFAAPQSTLELSLDDLQDAGASPPPPPTPAAPPPPPTPAAPQPPPTPRPQSPAPSAGPRQPPPSISTPPLPSAGESSRRPSPATQGADPEAGSVPAPTQELLVQITASPSKVEFLSDGVEGLLGYPAVVVLGWTAEQWLEKVHQASLAEQLGQMWRGLVGQRFAPGALPEQVMEYDLVHREGALIPCRVTWRAAQAEDGAFEGIELVIQPR